MFCIKCGKKLETSGICRFCGKENNVLSEHNYFRSPEIEKLFRDDEDFLLVKEMLSSQKNTQQESRQIKEQTNQKQTADSVRDAAKPQTDKSPELSGTAEAERKDPVTPMPASSVPQQKQSVPDILSKKTPGTGSLSYGRKSSGKRWIIAVCAVLVVALTVSVTGIALSKKKDKNSGKDSSVSSSDIGHGDKEPTTVSGEVPAETETTSETGTSESTPSPSETTAAPETTTEPAQEKGPINVGVISAYSSGNDIVNDMRNSLFTESNGFVCNELNIADGEIDTQNYDMIVLPAPAADLPDEQINKLKKFLENDNKNFLYIPSMNNVETANINKLLEEWSMKVNYEGYIYNAGDGCYSKSVNTDWYGDQYCMKLSVKDKSLTGESDYGSKDINSPMTKEITIDDGSKNAKKLLDAPEQSKIAKDGKTEDAESGCAAAISSSDKGNTHVIVFGSSEMFSDDYINNEDYANKDVILGILKTAAGREISSGEPENQS